MTTTTTETRNATLADLAERLKADQARKLDAVVPAAAIDSIGGVLHIAGMSHEALAGLGDDIPGRFLPTAQMDEHIAEKLGVPLAYLRRMRETRVDLYDANVNGWLRGEAPHDPWTGEFKRFAGNGDADQRKFLVRTFTTSDDEPGIGRALLSDAFACYDYLDHVTATLQAIRDTGVPVEVVGCDLNERRMLIKVACPTIAAAAPKLLGGYRSPVDGYDLSLETLAKFHSADHLGWDRAKGEYPPVVFAGFEIGGSETGGGATTITPRIVVAACKNGLRISKALMRKVHLGARMEPGQVRWSGETHRRNIELISAMTRDAVATCLSQEFLDEQVAAVEGKADTPVTAPHETIKVVGKQLAFTEEQTDLVLDHFIRGGQMTAGGLVNAITSAAQAQDVEGALAMESAALQALDLVAA